MLFSRRFRASTSQPQRMAGPAGPTPGFLRTCRDALPPTQPGVLAEGKVPLQPDALTRGCSSWPGDAEAVGIRHRSPLPSLPAHPWEPHLGRLWQLEHLGCEERPGGGGRETRPSACGQGQGQGHPHSGALPRTRGPAEVAVSSMRKRSPGPPVERGPLQSSGQARADPECGVLAVQGRCHLGPFAASWSCGGTARRVVLERQSP